MVLAHNWCSRHLVLIRSRGGEDAIVHVSEADHDHKKVPWIKTGDVILGPDQISLAYSILRAARKF
jgi:hypothetical protein